MIQRNNSRQAAVAPLVALMMIPLMGAVALALDGGMILDYKRAVQAAADEAALAGAIEIYTNYPALYGDDSGGLAAASAVTTAAANGFNGTNSLITVKTYGQEAKMGRFAGTSLPRGYIEVTIEYRQQRGFSAIWGSDDVTVVGHAVGRGAWIPLKNGVIALKPSGDQTFKSNGNGTINVKNGDVIVNSNGAAAGKVAGTGASINVLDENGNIATEGIYITGGAADNGAGFNPTPMEGVPPTPDPLGYLPEPSVPADGTEISTNTPGGGKTLTLTPGYHRNFKPNGQVNKVVLLPGLHYFADGFQLNNVELVATEVTIFNAGTNSNEGIKITSGSAKMTITPPTTGTYKGISIFQARGSTAPLEITGQGQMEVRGTVYGDSAEAKIAGNGDVSVAGQVIAGTVTVGGNGETNIDFRAPDAPNVRIMQLVE